ncbi:MAG: Gfo/Idh/MocA family oxidoreductase [Actinobacteria bacterium]|nr:Gfo/Idh/MocA family oxidoreductase [Actinomycetota bacterium]
MSTRTTAGHPAAISLSPLRGILVGCGYIATQQLDAWSQIDEVEIVALVDVDEAKARFQADRCGISATYSDLSSALEKHNVDFVDIATPPPTHLDLVRISVEAGAHVLCQKPLAPSLGEIDEMVDIADDAGVQLVVNENMRFQPWFLRMKELIEPGPIGRPFYVHWSSRARLTMPAVRFDDQPYFATMPRLAIYELGVHFFDTMRFLFGEPLALSAALGRASSDIAGEDHAAVLVSYDDLIAIMDISWASIPTYSLTDAVSWAVATVEGEGGTMHLSIDGRLRVITDDSDEVFEFGSDPIGDSFIDMQRRFVQCVSSGVDCETSAREYAKTMELVFGSYASAADQQVYRVGEDRGGLL